MKWIAMVFLLVACGHDAYEDDPVAVAECNELCQYAVNDGGACQAECLQDPHPWVPQR